MPRWRIVPLLLFLLLLCLGLLLVACTREAAQPDANAEGEVDQRVGVLLVSHGSHAKQWREMLFDLEAAVTDEILAGGRVTAVKTAFMEYNEPSIATQMRAFDAEDFDEVILVPLLLTVSTHALDDIPTIVGIKSDPNKVAQLAEEDIEVYRAKARVTVTPTLDFSTLLKKNVLHRARALREDLSDTGIVLVGYGDKAYNQQWEALMGDIGRYLKLKAEVDTVAYAWCGHIVDYSAQPTTDAVNQVFELEDRVMVIPLLVAYDPNFQVEIIQKGVEQAKRGSEVLYRPDSILPDDNLNAWVIEIVRQTVAHIG